MHGITTAIELGALLLIGDGIMGLIKLRWHSLLWHFWAGACEFKYQVARTNGALAQNVPLTPALLRLDPMFNALRGYPRFQELAAEKMPYSSSRASWSCSPCKINLASKSFFVFSILAIEHRNFLP